MSSSRDRSHCPFVTSQRNEHLGFNAHESSGDEDEFGCQVDIEIFHRVYIAEEIISNLGNRNVINIELIALNKEQEKVKRTLKSINSDRVCRIHQLHLEGQR